jgi:hypothetical protein
LLNAGFFNTAYSDGKPDLALFNSSIAGVTAASIGGTYTLKLDEEWVYEDKNGEELEKPFPRWVVNKELVPGGAPEPQPTPTVNNWTTEPGGGGQKVTPDNLTSDQGVLKDMYCLWTLGGYGTRPQERSMWVVNNNNSYSSIPWPWKADYKSESWNGPPPSGAVAIAHTHPDNNTQGPRSSPKPSKSGGNTGEGDHGTANKIGMPVYVVTGQGIWKAVPNVNDPVQVADSNWYKQFEKKKEKCK